MTPEISSWEAVFRPQEHMKKVLEANRRGWDSELHLYSPAINTIHRLLSEGKSISGEDGKSYRTWPEYKEARIKWVKSQSQTQTK